HLLKQLGIEASNLYAGFLAAATQLLEPEGELVAITPRSFCNGPYFKSFRTDFLKIMSIKRLHLFDSRSAVFNQDKVLQENIIFHAVKGVPKPEKVLISSNSGAPGSPISERRIAYAEMIS